MMDHEPVPFGLAMASVSGSTPFIALVFNDGAAVSLHSVRPLASELGLKLPHSTVFELIENWDHSFTALVTLVQALAYGDEAQGHRGNFVSEDLLTMERLLPEARQTIRVGDGMSRLVAASAQVGANASIKISENMLKAKPNVCLGAIMGNMCHNADRDTVAASIAGWTLATEMVRLDQDGMTRCAAPGALIVGPVFVPAPFAPSLLEGEVLLALTGAPAFQGSLHRYAAELADEIAVLSEDMLLLPGDIVVCGPPASEEVMSAGTVDTVEAVAAGFGRQTVSLC